MKIDVSTMPDGWKQPFELLRKKWGTIPAGKLERRDSAHLLTLLDDELLKFWEASTREQTEEFDVITTIGSLINDPQAVTKREIDLLKPHLRSGRWWLHLAYPKDRWEREGSVSFDSGAR